MTKTDYKFAQPDREFIKKIFAWQESLRKANNNAGYNEFPLEIAFVLNQIGEVVPFSEENIKDQEDQLREKLERFKLGNVPIFATDAACALWSTIACDSTRKLSDRENDNLKHYAIRKDASPEENLECSRFASIIYEELPKYLAKVKYTSVLGKNIRDISILTDQCRQSIERRIDNFKATAEEIKVKRDKFEQDVTTCQEQLEYINTENVPFLLDTMVKDFCDNELPSAITAAKKRFVVNCKNRKFKFEKLVWMDTYATKMLNEVIEFIREKLSEKYCDLRNTVFLSRVKTIMERYDFSKSLSVESLKRSLSDLTMPPDTLVTSVGWKAILYSPLSMFDRVVEKMAEGFLENNEDNINGVLGAVIQHHSDSFKMDVGKIFNDLVQRVRADFDETEAKLFMNKEERENTERLLAEYKQEVQEIFDSLAEIHDQIKRFSSEQQ